jgi:lambda family phage portal protein
MTEIALRDAIQFNFAERALSVVAPQWALQRAGARLQLGMLREVERRHFEAAQPGRRTKEWRRTATDANSAAGPALATLRNHARELVRNNPWAKRGKQIIANNAVGWGIVPKPIDIGVRITKDANALWSEWAGSTQCDYDGQHDMYGLQRLAAATIAESGEVLVRRYYQPSAKRKRLAIPIKLQVLEPDHLDTSKHGYRLANGNRLIYGVEFDSEGERVAYWLYREHPGASGVFGLSQIFGTSVRVPAEDVLHVYYKDRATQVRGYTWFAAAIVKLKDFDEYEDATLIRQKIAACFAAFVTDTSGNGTGIGAATSDPLVERLEPGMIHKLPIGKSIEFASPPAPGESKYDVRVLRAISAGLGIPYEDLTGDYSNMPFSAARMGRIAFRANVHDWQYNMLIPMLCGPIWQWAMQAAFVAGEIGGIPGATWTPPAPAAIDPDKEARANILRVRGGQATLDEIVREQGYDPDVFWVEYAVGMQRLDSLGLVLDSDARHVSQAGTFNPPPDSEAATNKVS